MQRESNKPLHQQFEDLDRTVFSAFCTSFDGLQWNIRAIEDNDYSGIDLQATGATKQGKYKTYDVELKSRITLTDFRVAKNCFFQPDKWLSLCQYDNEYKIYFVIYPNCDKIAIWNITGALLRKSEKDITAMRKNTASGSKKVEKQVYRLSIEDAKVYTFDLSDYKNEYNALYKQISNPKD